MAGREVPPRSQRISILSLNFSIDLEDKKLLPWHKSLSRMPVLQNCASGEEIDCSTFNIGYEKDVQKVLLLGSLTNKYL